MIQPTDLVNYGYKKHVSESIRATNRAEALFQKPFRDDDGKLLYYLNWYQYGLGYQYIFAWSVDCQLHYTTSSGNEATVNIEHFVDENTTVGQVEDFFANLHTRMHFLPDPHND